MKKLPLIVLGILIVTQLAIPFSMIQSRENILHNGEIFKFITRPIDPADPFQGRYVRLGIQNDYVSRPRNAEYDMKRRSAVYAVLEADEDGFARFTSLMRERPATGQYLKTRYRGHRRRWDDETKAHIFMGDRIDIPFDRFYMDEAKAPRAERLARESTRSTNCWVNVRILNGKAVIEDVFAEGQSLRDLAAGGGD